jgi:hypothetical protein
MKRPVSTKTQDFVQAESKAVPKDHNLNLIPCLRGQGHLTCRARKTLNISTSVSLRKTMVKDNLRLIPAHSPPAVHSIKFSERTVALLRRMDLRNSRAQCSRLIRITVVKH